MAFWDKLKNAVYKGSDFVIDMYGGAVKDIRNLLVAKEYAERTDEWSKQKEEEFQLAHKNFKEATDPKKKEMWKKRMADIAQQENPYQFMYDMAEPTLNKSNAQLAAGALKTGVDVGLTAMGGAGVAGKGVGLTTKVAAPTMLSRAATQAGSFAVQSAAGGFNETGETDEIGRNLTIGAAEGLIFGEIPGIRSAAKRMLAAGAVGAGGAYARGERDPMKLAQSGALTATFQGAGEIMNKATGQTGAIETPILGGMRKNFNKYNSKLKVYGEGKYGDYAAINDQAVRKIGVDEFNDLLATGNIRPSDGKHINVLADRDELEAYMARGIHDPERNITVVFKPEMSKKLYGKNPNEVSHFRGAVGFEDIERVILPNREIISSIGKSPGFINLGADLNEPKKNGRHVDPSKEKPVEMNFYRGEGGKLDQMTPEGVDALGRGFYGDFNKDLAKKFAGDDGQILHYKVKVKPSEVLTLATAEDQQNLVKMAIREFPELGETEAIRAFAKSKGYKVISASKDSPLTGSVVVDENIITPVNDAAKAKRIDIPEDSQTIAEISAQGGQRPQHQMALEEALNSGDNAMAKKIWEAMPDDDPYKASMKDLIPGVEDQPVARVAAKDTISKLSKEDQDLMAGYAEQIKAAQYIIEQKGQNSREGIQAVQRINEIKDEIQETIGRKATLKNMGEEEFLASMMGSDQAINVSHLKNGQLARDLKEIGLNRDMSGDEVVTALNKRGYSFDNEDEVIRAITQERASGTPINPKEQSTQKINDWLNEDKVTISVGTKSSKEVASAPVVKAEDLSGGQMELLSVARKTDLAPGIKEQIKSDMSTIGKISSSTWENLKDDLTQKKRLDPEFVIREDFYSYKQLENELRKNGVDMPADIRRQQEQKIVDRVLATAKGNTDKYIEKLKNLGIDDDIIQSAMISRDLPLSKTIKVKRETNGEISADISEGLIDHIRKNFKLINKKQKDTMKFLDDSRDAFADESFGKILAENGVDVDQFKDWYRSELYKKGLDLAVPEKTRWIPKFSKENMKKTAGNILSEFEVPQQYFKRIGLKDVIYDPIRAGERNTEIFRNESVAKLKPYFAKLSKKDRENITYYFMSKQGKGEDLAKAGITPPKFKELSKQQQLAVGAWDRFKKEIEPQISGLAKNHGIEMNTIDWYFPLYTKKDLVKVGGFDFIDEAIRKEPFFKSLKEREQNVPINLYENDSWALIDAYINGSSRFLKLGEKTLPLKYLIDSDQFAGIVGKETQGEVRSWFKEITTPKTNPSPIEAVVQGLRKGAYRSFLGLNPRTIMKQGISYIDMAIGEGAIPGKGSKMVRQLQKGQQFASVSERVPDISIADISDKYDKAILFGVTNADKKFAGGSLSALLAKKLEKIKKENGSVSSKDIRKALQMASDDVDLAMGGVTPAQRSKVYRSEIGKLGLMFTSTVNSRLQWYIQKTTDGIKAKDAKALAKIATAFILSAYTEVAISKLALNWDDTETMIKDTAKSMAGNIPMVGGLMFAYDSGKWEASAALSNFTDAITKTSEWAKDPDIEGFIGAGSRWLETAGLPKQIRRTVEGLDDEADLRHAVGGKNIDYDSEKKSSSVAIPSPKGNLESRTRRLRRNNSSSRFQGR